MKRIFKFCAIFLGTFFTAGIISCSDDNDNNNNAKTIEHEECLPIADCSEGDGFMYVGFNTISNYSGCGNNGFTDFTDISTTVYLGNTYELIVESDYDEQYMTVWIDYNDDMFFEDDEVVINNQLFIVTGTNNNYLSFLRQKNAIEKMNFKKNQKVIIKNEFVELVLGRIDFINNQPVVITPKNLNLDNLRVIIND